MSMQAIAERVASEALPTIDASLARMISDELAANEWYVALIDLIEGAPSAVPAEVVDALERFLGDRDDPHSQVGRKVIARHRALTAA